MWHKPCRTFHPWCLCIKTRCLSSIVTAHTVLDGFCLPTLVGGSLLSHSRCGCCSESSIIFIDSIKMRCSSLGHILPSIRIICLCRYDAAFPLLGGSWQYCLHAYLLVKFWPQLAYKSHLKKKSEILGFCSFIHAVNSKITFKNPLKI